MANEPQIQARAITRATGEAGHALLLQPTDFSLCGGDRVAITGPSGSGKSLFLRTLALLDAPSCGEVLWQGKPIADAQVPHYRNRICYLSQRPALLDGTVEENLRLPYALKTMRPLTFDLDAVRTLLEHAGKAPGFLAKTASDLSGGESQVVALIRTLQLNPDVLLLDEPTAALDPASAQAVERLIQAWFEGTCDKARAYIWVTHDREQAQRMSNAQWRMVAGVLTGPVR